MYLGDQILWETVENEGAAKKKDQLALPIILGVVLGEVIMQINITKTTKET